MEATVVRRARRIDPTTGLDEYCDVLVAGGIVERVGAAGSSSEWELIQDVRIIDAPVGQELVICPGLVDLHTHVYGASSVDDIDRIGVNAGVPVIADAGGSSAATIDDFVAHRLRPAATRVKIFLALELGGIVESHIGHNTTGSAAQKQTASLDEFLGAVERHLPRIAGLKVWATSSAGLQWVDHATSLSELVQQRLLVHVGDTEPEPRNQPITGDVLDRLQGGDIVTHCYTALPGALIDERGRMLNEVSVARSRGILFDAAPGKINLSFDRAVAAFEQGWLPDTISTDLHRWSIDHPVQSLANVMSSFLALGLTLEQIIKRASITPASIIDAVIGRPIEGEPATLSLLSLRSTPAIFSDGSGGTIRGDQVIEPVGCFVDGDWHAAAPLNRGEPKSAGIDDADRPYLIDVMAELQRLAGERKAWRGSELHQAVHRVRVHHGVPLSAGLDALFDQVLDTPPTMAAGWVLEELGADRTLTRFSEALGD